MDYKAYYQSKLGTVEDALAAVKTDTMIAVGLQACEPRMFMDRLHEVAPRVENVSIWTGVYLGSYKFMGDTSLKGHININSMFYNVDCRKGHDSGRYDMYPVNLHYGATMTIDSRRPNLFVAACSPMDENGNVYIGFDAEYTQEWMDAADYVVFEVNKQLPKVYGDTCFPITKADLIYEADYSLTTLPDIPITDTDRKIAEYVSSLVEDGDTIQLGIGGMPNAVGEALISKKDLGIHTEMFTTSMGKLMSAGVITNERKTLDKGISVATFAAGDQHLYDVMADNPKVNLRRGSYTNDPCVILRQENMVSINTALEIDLTGQVCSESIGHRQYSGTGGATDFAYGAFHSKGGKGIIAFNSTAQGGKVSKIKTMLTPGAVVSISRNIVDYVVTEYGIAPLKHKSVRQRVDNLIAVAHPDFRAQLRKEAEELKLWW